MLTAPAAAAHSPALSTWLGCSKMATARVNAQAQPHASRTVQQQDAGEEGSPACAAYPRKQR